MSEHPLRCNAISGEVQSWNSQKFLSTLFLSVYQMFYPPLHGCINLSKKEAAACYVYPTTAASTAGDQQASLGHQQYRSSVPKKPFVFLQIFCTGEIFVIEEQTNVKNEMRDVLRFLRRTRG